MPSKRLVSIARKLANESTHPITKVGCVVYKGHSISSLGINTTQYIGYRRDVFNFSPTRHAEISALHNIKRTELEGSDMLVYRLDKNGEIGSAKPCSACIQAIVGAGIRRVHYTSNDGSIKTVTVSKINLEEWEKELPL